MYEAFLEIKAAWNGTEGCCSWYLMGADGFKAKLERGIEFKTVGFAEIRSRCGDKYNSILRRPRATSAGSSCSARP